MMLILEIRFSIPLRDNHFAISTKRKAQKFLSTKSLCWLCLLLSFFAPAVWAEDPNSLSDSAVANILFDYDNSSEFATYAIDGDGFVSITFARDVPEILYGEIITKLQNNSDIAGVLPDRGGSACGLFP